MNIVFATQQEAEELRKKYIVLELDSFILQGSNDAVISWCVLDTSTVSLKDLPQMSQYVDLHTNMMRNYRLRNWKYCEDALEHLIGKWRGELDSFYSIFSSRINNLKDQSLSDDWSGVIDQNHKKSLNLG